MTRSFVAIVGIAWLFLSPQTAVAASCTWGSDCYENCVRDSDGSSNNVSGYANSACQAKGYPIWENVVLVEDGENPGYSTSTADGAGAWSDDGSNIGWCQISGTRGAGSTYRSKYGGLGGSVQPGCGWSIGQPSSATRGATFSSGACGQSAGEWDDADAWQANSFACVVVYEAGEGLPANVSTPIVTDGNAAFGELRLPDTFDSPGAALWGSATTVTLSAALSFSSNYLSQKSGAVKFGEWLNANGDARSHLAVMGSGPDNLFPFANLLLWPGTISKATCDSAMSGATFHVGSPTVSNDPCNSVGGGGSGWISVQPAGYDRSTDWPNLTVPHAVRFSLKGLGSSSAEWKVWHQDDLILHISGIDSTLFSSEARAISGLDWDHYWNQNADDTSPTTQAVARWWDNLMVRAWSDASCASAGSDCGAVPTLAEMGLPIPECRDGVDNDADTYADFGADAGCYSEDDPSEDYECSDGIDNDGDGQVDSNDSGCNWSQPHIENPECSDGLDNDSDTYADYPDDQDCDGPWYWTESSGSTCGLLGIEVLVILPFARIRRRIVRANRKSS